MTRPIEQELAELFRDAVAHLEIRPVPARRSRAAALSRAVTVGLAAAVLAGLVLVSLRIAGDGAQRTVPAGPADTPAAEALLAAMQRTWSQPLRIETSTTLTEDVPAGAPQTAPQTTRTVAEIDEPHELGLLTRDDGGPDVMAVAGHVYVAIQASDRDAYQLPASARWYEVPIGSASANDLLGVGLGGVTTADALRAALTAGQAKVMSTGPDQYLLTIRTPSQPGDQNVPWLRGVRETVHVSPSGEVDRVELTNAFGPDDRVHLTGTVTIARLGRPVRAQSPDPSSVLSAQEWQAHMSTGMETGTSGSSGYQSSCTVTIDPSPASGSSGLGTPQECTMSSSGTSHGVRVRPERR